jgi:hypothetical protein
MKAKKIYGVPVQVKGAFFDTESEKEIASAELIIQKFSELKKRFFSVNNWKDYCGNFSAEFKLFDRSGDSITRNPKAGDYIRIDIPGPGDYKAKGYDWVEIVELNDTTFGEEKERWLMMCRPCQEPSVQTEHIAHFYSDQTTSTIIISRFEKSIKVGIYGRNEITNYKTGWIGKIRNFMISLGGYTSLTKIQWKTLAEGLLNF